VSRKGRRPAAAIGARKICTPDKRPFIYECNRAKKPSRFERRQVLRGGKLWVAVGGVTSRPPEVLMRQCTERCHHRQDLVRATMRRW
jgi:hypothetical protein